MVVVQQPGLQLEAGAPEAQASSISLADRVREAFMPAKFTPRVAAS